MAIRYEGQVEDLRHFLFNDDRETDHFKSGRHFGSIFEIDSGWGLHPVLSHFSQAAGDREDQRNIEEEAAHFQRIQREADRLYQRTGPIEEGIERLADDIVKRFPRPDDTNEDLPVGMIPDEAVDVLTEITVSIIADLIQAYIDAGSEREVTHENEDLREAIRREYNDWSVAEFRRYQEEHQSESED